MSGRNLVCAFAFMLLIVRVCLLVKREHEGREREGVEREREGGRELCVCASLCKSVFTSVRAAW